MHTKCSLRYASIFGGNKQGLGGIAVISHFSSVLAPSSPRRVKLLVWRGGSLDKDIMFCLLLLFLIWTCSNQCLEVTGAKEGRASRSIVTKTERAVQRVAKKIHFTSTGLG